jgi:site-specific DNA recombinase
VAAGRVPWRAPLGYSNVKGINGGANIVPDDDAPLVRRAFELVGSGAERIFRALQIVTSEGLCSRSGKPLSDKTFHHMLRNPLYAGWVSLKTHPETPPTRGLHEPIVSQETFDRVQAILEGRKPLVPRRRKLHPDFPLRSLVRCGFCDTALTGAFCRGRSNTFPRYWCWRPECRKVSVPKVRLENDFVEFLGRLKPSPETAADFPDIVEKVWRARLGGSDAELRKLKASLEELRTQKANLLTMRTKLEITGEEFAEANDDYVRRMRELQQQIQSAASLRSGTESFRKFAELQLLDISHAWNAANPEQRKLVQSLLFEDGLSYMPDSGYSNRSKSSLFSSLETMVREKEDLVDLIGIEPMTSSMPGKRAPSCATGPLSSILGEHTPLSQTFAPHGNISGGHRCLNR